MKFEQPSVSNTQDDLDAKLAKARAEAAARESSEVKESTKTEIAGIDSLLSEIKEEKEPEKPVDKTEKIEIEKIRESVEKMMPKFHQMVELVVDKGREYEGRMDYATLTNNVDLYMDARYDDASAVLEAENLFRGTMKQITGHHASSYVGSSEVFGILQKEKELSQTALGALHELQFASTSMHARGRWDAMPSTEARMWGRGEKRSEKMKETAVRQMSGRMKYVDDGMVNRGTKSYFGTPDDFVESMQKRYEQTMRYSEEDMKKHAIDSRPDMRAFGFATAAIEAGDVEVAAKALAFADGVKSLDAGSVKELKDKLAKLEPGARKKFVSAYEQEKVANK